MGYGITPEVGGDFICAAPCEHKDCALNRTLIAKPCAICGKPMGEGVKFFFNGKNEPEHALCVWTAQEAKDKARA